MKSGRALTIGLVAFAVGCSAEGPAPSGETPALVVVEELRIGSVDGPLEEQFGDIWGVLADEAGSIYVFDIQAQEVRVFDPEGRFSHTIGAPGEGPGETTRGAGISLAPDGRLWVWEGPDAFHVFERDGTFVERHLRPIRGRLLPWSGGFGPDGRLIDWETWGAQPVGGRQERTSRLYRWSADMTRLDTLPGLDTNWPVTGPQGRPFENAASISFFLDHDGIWFANTHDYRIRHRSVEGDTSDVVLSLSVTPDPMTSEDVEEVMAREAAFPEDVRLTTDQILPTKRIIWRIFGDGADRIYVVPHLEGVEAGSAIDVFTKDGEYQGRAVLPVLMSLPMPRPFGMGDQIYMVTKDEFDVPYVVRLRVE